MENRGGLGVKSSDKRLYPAIIGVNVGECARIGLILGDKLGLNPCFRALCSVTH